MRTEKYKLYNCNSCGQGYYLPMDYRCIPLIHKLILDFGYKYSHSTNVGTLDNKWRLWHTFIFNGHTVGYYEDSIHDCSTSCGAGKIEHWVYGYCALEKHLKYKQKKYKLI